MPAGYGDGIMPATLKESVAHPRPSAAALALGQAILPPGRTFLPGLTPEGLSAIYPELGLLDRRLPDLFEGLCQALDLLALPRTGHRFRGLDPHRQQDLLRAWSHGRGEEGRLLAMVSALLKLHFFDSPEIFAHYGVTYNKAPAVVEPLPRALTEHIRSGKDLVGEELEADVLVAGSGAAGAIVAKELAEAGHAVILVESGSYFRRTDFQGRFLPATRRFYHWQTRNHVVGNVFISLPTGRTVGGSTTINTATCFRPPAWVHRRWEALGLPQLSQEAMRPFFEEVESVMQVAPTPRKLWGAHVELMNGVLDRLGLGHAPIQRNAPDCDGQNACDFGCPSGGKYSQDLAYVPMALRHGALLLTETELTSLDIEGGRVRGARLRAGDGEIRVRAPRVVLCCGTLITPELLWNQGLGGPHVGRHLTIQPSVSVSARLPREVRGYGDLVPSSHVIHEFQDERLMFMSANLPVDMAAMPLLLVGDELMEVMEDYRFFGHWGVLLAETVEGRLHKLPNGDIATLYFMNRADAARLQWGLSLLCEIYLDAGATPLYPSVRGFPIIRDRHELKRFRRATISPADFLMTAYHALGTCRMGPDPATSVVDPEYRLRGVSGLSIVDGSVVPGPLGINSQLTVMAFALRGARLLCQQIEEGS